MVAAIYARKNTDQHSASAEARTVALPVERARTHALKNWLLVLVLLVVPLDAAGQFPGQRERLRGLQGVRLVVDEVDADAERDGLTRTAIQTDAELKLRLAGIAVSSTPGVSTEPVLMIPVDTLNRDGLYAFHVAVELAQIVSSPYRPGVTFPATTWQARMIATVGAQGLPNSVRDTVKDLVDRFINDYLAANPKKGG